jgi:uncharacterized protein YjiS (DUF1127 family)
MDIFSSTGETIMTAFISALRTTLAKRRAYNRAIAEIAQLNARELSDMGVDQSTLIAGARREIYGAAH